MNLADFRHLSLTRFLEELSANDLVWYAKRLSGNDTGLTGAHQAGPYVPREFATAALPNIATTRRFNPTIDIPCVVASHDVEKNVKAKYYNSKYFPEHGLKKKYDEFRLTRWTETPFSDAGNTGSLFVLAAAPRCDGLVAWVAKTAEEENLIEDWLGIEIDPGQTRTGRGLRVKLDNDSRFARTMPEEWNRRFPSPDDIFEYVTKRMPHADANETVDELLLARRALEYKVFQCVERKEVEQILENGFSSVESFFQTANSLLNRRKARSGASLEKHLALIFRDARIRFDEQVTTEQSKRPDFVFPSAIAYHDASFDPDRLHMLAAKTCCKDRWRQVIHEAERITPKHLFTLQEGISSQQLAEMEEYKVVVVTPRPNVKAFPKEWQPKILDLTAFLNIVREKDNIPPGASA